MYKGVIPFIGLQLLALVVVANYPALVNYLPNRISLTSDTAPPPLNPRLQYCIKEYVFAELDTNGAKIRNSITKASKMDISYLPKKLQAKTREGFGSAISVFELRDAVKKTESEVIAVRDDYAKLHREVRRIQKDIRKINKELKLAEDTMDRRKYNNLAVDHLEEQVVDLKAQRQKLEESLPSNWKSENEKYVALTKAEVSSLRKYHRNTDQAYEVIGELVATISAADQLASLEKPLEELGSRISGLKSKEAQKAIAETSKLFSPIEGTKEIKKHLSRARKLLRGKKAKPEKAQKSIDKAVNAFKKDLEWRRRAKVDLLPDLTEYDQSIRNTIGLRLQPKLPKEIALVVAGCNSAHRDISLSF